MPLAASAAPIQESVLPIFVREGEAVSVEIKSSPTEELRNLEFEGVPSRLRVGLPTIRDTFYRRFNCSIAQLAFSGST